MSATPSRVPVAPDPARAIHRFLARPGRDEALDRLTRLARKVLAADVAFIGTLDGEAWHFRSVAGNRSALADGVTLPDRERAALANGGWLPLGAPVRVRTIDGATPRTQLCTLLAAPGGVVAGVIGVASESLRVWTGEDAEMLAEMAGVAMAVLSELCTRPATTFALADDDRFRALVANSRDGLWCLEFRSPVRTDLPDDAQIEAIRRHGYVAECNDAMARLHGVGGAHRYIGRHAGALIDPADPADVAMLKAFIASGYHLSDVETQSSTSPDARHYLNTIVGVVEGGDLVRVWGTQRDITTQKMLEAQLRQSQKMEAVGRLAGGVAHDFNNLLTAIQGHTELAIAEVSPDAAVHEDLIQIRNAAQRAARVTRQLLAFSRKQLLAPDLLDLNAIVSSMESMLRPMIGEHIDLRSVLWPNLGRIRADAGQVEQVLLNLVVNAKDAMPTGGSLTLRTRELMLEADDPLVAREELPAGPYVELGVSDSGEGIDPGMMPHIFEPFFTTRETGTGLGLATVYGIVRQSGGDIRVESEPGRGTTFSILLPLVEAAAPARMAGEGPVGADATVLIVEWEEGVRAVARRTLRTRGYTVIEAATGPEALRVAEHHDGPIHLLLTNPVIPRLPGSQLPTELARTRPDIRVLYMGAAGDGVGRWAGGTRGGSVIEKPFTPDALAEAVHRVLGTGGDVPILVRSEALP